MNTQYFEYSKFAKKHGLFYVFLILIVIIPLPFYSEVLFDHQIKEKNAYILQIIGLLFIVLYLWSDYDNKKSFINIEIDSERIKSLGNNAEVNIRWSDIERVEKLTSGDKETLNALGMKGVRIIAENGDEIVIYESINDYDVLLNIINSRKP